MPLSFRPPSSAALFPQFKRFRRGEADDDDADLLPTGGQTSRRGEHAGVNAILRGVVMPFAHIMTMLAAPNKSRQIIVMFANAHEAWRRRPCNSVAGGGGAGGDE